METDFRRRRSKPPAAPKRFSTESAAGRWSVCAMGSFPYCRSRWLRVTNLPIASFCKRMFGIHDFALFITTGILLNLTPGPDTLYILGRSVAHGRPAGVASALGISVGSIFHTCAAALGLSAVLATSASAFIFVKLAGGAYLIF